MLIGKGGNTLKKVMERTRTIIHVPGRDRADQPVRIKAETMSRLLHGCWEVSILVLRGVSSPVACTLRVLDESGVVEGQLFYPGDTGQFMLGEGGVLSAFCLQSGLDVVSLEVLVDNERFAHPDVTAQCDFISVAEKSQNLLFIYGSEREGTKQLSSSLRKEMTVLWSQKCAVEQHPGDSKLAGDDLKRPHGALTVGTYNILHPIYAEKYKEKPGIDQTGRSNWPLRGPAITRILLHSGLDVCFLQEIDAHQMEHDLMSGYGGASSSHRLEDLYQCIHFVHPNREARDGVAVLLRKDRFVVEKSKMLPYEARFEQYRGEHYMCAATVFAKDVVSGMRLLFASVHFYDKKSVHPQRTLLNFLQEHNRDFDAVVWGGDCNNEYKSGPPGNKGEFASGTGGRCTRKHKKIDWLFFTAQLASMQSEVSEAFVEKSKEILETTGYPPSDHFAEAITLAPYEGDAE